VTGSSFCGLAPYWAAALGAAEEIRGALAAAREALQRTKRDRAQRTL